MKSDHWPRRRWLSYELPCERHKAFAGAVGSGFGIVGGRGKFRVGWCQSPKWLQFISVGYANEFDAKGRWTQRRPQRNPSNAIAEPVDRGEGRNRLASPIHLLR